MTQHIIAKRSTRIAGISQLQLKDMNAVGIAAPSAAEITKNISDASLKEAASAIGGAKMQAQLATGDQVTGLLGSTGFTGDAPGINSHSGIKNGTAAAFVDVSLGASINLVNKGEGGSPTERLIGEMITPGFDQGRAGGGYAKEDSKTDPKDEPGTGWLGLSQNQKDSMGAAGAVFGAVAVIGAVVAGVATSPVTVPLAAGAAIGGAISAAGYTVLEKKGTPNPDSITGATPGLVVTGKGVGFDPITGQGVTKTETLGQFTGEEVGFSGVILTKEEARIFQEGISKGQDSFLKDPNPMDDSSGSTIVDERSWDRVDFILAGGGLAGPLENNFQQFAGLQNMNFSIAADALIA